MAIYNLRKIQPFKNLYIHTYSYLRGILRDIDNMNTLSCREKRVTKWLKLKTLGNILTTVYT